jgi:hypothetical protein
MEKLKNKAWCAMSEQDKRNVRKYFPNITKNIKNEAALKIQRAYLRKLANKQGLGRLVHKPEIEKMTKETLYKYVKKLTKDVNNGLKKNITDDIVNQLGGLSWLLSKLSKDELQQAHNIAEETIMINYIQEPFM